MKRLILLALFAVSSAHAQLVVPPCYPLINGVHPVAPRLFDGEVGRHVYWFCSPRGGETKIYGFSCLHGQCSMGAVQAAQQAIISATAKVTEASKAYTNAVKFSCGDAAILGADSPQGALCRERKSVLESFGPAWVKP